MSVTGEDRLPPEPEAVLNLGVNFSICAGACAPSGVNGRSELLVELVRD